jgi:hypothetical protein
MTTWRYASLRDTVSAAALAAKEDVSVVARSSRGFLAAYEKYRKPSLVEAATDSFSGQKWGVRRAAFIARTLPSYISAPSERRRLALLTWAFDPNGSLKKVVP